jgi:hypothetical protein
MGTDDRGLGSPNMSEQEKHKIQSAGGKATGGKNLDANARAKGGKNSHDNQYTS